MRDRCEVEPYAVVATEMCEGALGEVGAIVGDDAVGVAVPVDDVAEETDRGPAVQYLDRLRLDPLGELSTTRNMLPSDPLYWSLKGHAFSFVTFL